MQQNLLSSVKDQLDWLGNSGIQAPQEDADGGGVYAWIDTADGKPAFLYSEITGYFVTLCCHLSRFGNRDLWLSRAQGAASWIVDRAMTQEGAILARKYDQTAQGRAAADRDPFCFEKKQVLFFDAAMVGFGLLSLHELDNDRRWSDAAKKIGKFCQSHFLETENGPSAVYDLSENKPQPPQERWSLFFGSFELKGAMFLHLLAQKGELWADTWVDRLIERALQAQTTDGRFPTTLSGQATHLHPHFYTVEGLLFLAARRQRPELLEPAFAAIEWAFTNCLQPQHLLQQWSTEPQLVINQLRSDALSQGLRASYLGCLLRPGHSWSFEDNLAELHAQLDGFALPGGGLSYGQDEYGQKMQHANAWCHFFRLEMELYRRLEQLPEQGLIIT